MFFFIGEEGCLMWFPKIFFFLTMDTWYDQEMESLFEHRIEELVCAAQVRIEQVCSVPKIQTYHVSAYVSVAMSN